MKLHSAILLQAEQLLQKCCGGVGWFFACLLGGKKIQIPVYSHFDIQFTLHALSSTILLNATLS